MRRKKRAAKHRFFNILIKVALLVIIFYMGKALLTPRLLSKDDVDSIAKDNIGDLYDRDSISGDVPDEAVDSLEAMAVKDRKVLSILKNSEEYPPQLLESLASNPELLDFTLDYPEKKGTWKENINLSRQYKRGQIPLFIQWDEDWGYAPYGGGVIGLTGCGPTCLSMVAVGLTGDTSLNPKAVAAFSEENGYLDRATDSTNWTLMTEGAKQLGLHSKVVPLDKQRMIDELSSGHPIICSMRPGDFTSQGHFIVIYQYKNDKFMIRDPNSKIRSKKAWDYDTLEPQIRNIWSFSA